MILDQNGRPLEGDKKPVLREIAAVGVRDRWSSYPSNGLTPERLAAIFREADTGDVMRQSQLFEEMEEKDTHLFSVLQSRKNAVLGLDWEVMPASDDPEDVKVAQFVGEVLYNLTDLEDAFLDLLDAIGKGFAVTEILWEIQDGKAIPTSLAWRPQTKFTFGMDFGELRVLTDAAPAMGETPPYGKLIVHTYRAKSGHPSRAGVCRVSGWMYLFKNYSLKDWVAFAEVFGTPLRLGKYDPSASPEDREALKLAIQQLGSDAAGIISNGTEIEFVKTEVNTAEVYEKLAAFCNAEISKAVLGQTLTTEVGSTGSYAASQTHAEVRQDLVESDAKALAKTFRRDLIKPLVLYNFGSAARLPWIKFHSEPPEDQERTSRIYATLVKDCGLPVSTEHVYEKFGIPKPAEGQALLVPPAPGGLPAPLPMKDPTTERPPAPGRVQAMVDDLADRALAAAGNPLAKILEPLKAIIDQSTSFEDLRARIERAFPDLDSRDLEDLVFRATFGAELFGRWTARGA
ncbi:MAG: DUF935 domain-containing protein [Desulfobacteria bacterium]